MTTVAEVRERVRRLLGDVFGAPDDVDGSLVTEVAGTKVVTNVEAHGDRVDVGLSTSVLDDVASSEDLLRYVATQPVRLGSLRAVERADGRCSVGFVYTLLGETLDPEELRHAVEALADSTRQVHADLARILGPGAAGPAPDDGDPVIALGPHPPPAVPPRMTWFQGSIAAALPDGWYAKESLTVLAPDGQANVILSSEPLDASIDARRYAEVQGELLAREFPRYTEIGRGDTALTGGIPAGWRQFRWSPPDGLPVTQLQLYAVPVPGRGYTATATSSDAHWAGYAELLRFIVFQVVLRPPPGAA